MPREKQPERRGLATKGIILALLLSMLSQADASCYLMDANAKCAVCWRTTYKDKSDKTGITKMGECPEGIALKWTKTLPEDMISMHEYTTTYSLTLSTEKFGHKKSGNNDIPHANIHSCITSRGACTPFVSNSPGLATHTEALVGDFKSSTSSKGLETGDIEFTSDVRLTEETYTIIAHVRFFSEVHARQRMHPALILYCLCTTAGIYTAIF
jgi:hypothetical protein